MAGEWTVATLADGPLEIIDGDRGTNYPKQHEFAPSGHCLFLNAGNVTSTGFRFSDRAFISAEKDAALRKGKLRRHDIVLTTRGTVGNVAYFDDSVPYDQIRINSGMVILRAQCHTLRPRFLYLFLRSFLFRAQVDSLRTGSAQPQLPIRDINRVEIPVPAPEEQDAIAHILGTLDDKIELNRRMNETLEAIARVIFKSWFVDFDPVRAKMEGRQPAGMDAETAALFPDSFEDSPLGKIPKGWDVAPLNAVTTYMKRGISPKYIEGGGVCVLNQRCIRDRWIYNGNGRRHDPSARGIAGRELQLCDVLVNSTGVGTLGRVAQVRLLEETTIVDSHVTVVRADAGQLSPVVLGVALGIREAEIQELGEGSTGQTELSRARLGELLMLMPSLAVQGVFEKLVIPMERRRVTNWSESTTLARVRDSLLPKLLSGELRVKDTEKFVESAA